MRKFASHRLYIPHLDLLLRNHTVEIGDTGQVVRYYTVEIDDTGQVVRYYPFEGETCFTEWLNGLIVLSCDSPEISFDSRHDSIASFTVLFVDENKNIRSILSEDSDNSLLTLNAYYVTIFNVSDMSFSKESRIVRLG